jgi:phage tail-like protein
MQRNEIMHLLPMVFQQAIREGSPLMALLEVMEELHEPSEKILGQIDTIFSPYRAPDRFVPFLGHWVDLDRFFTTGSVNDLALPEATPPISTGLGPLRELIAAAAYLSKWRGTLKGLTLFLETATGVQGFEIDEKVSDPNGLPLPYHIQVRAPEKTAPHRRLIEMIIEQEKPAYVTYDLQFSPKGLG